MKWRERIGVICMSDHSKIQIPDFKFQILKLHILEYGI